jgi:hypothetical protein
VERRGGVEGAPLEGFFMIGSKFDRDVEGIPFVQGRNAKPVVERRVL